MSLKEKFEKIFYGQEYKDYPDDIDVNDDDDTFGGEGEEATWEYLAHVAATNEDYEGWEKELNFAVEVNSALFVDAYNNK